ncbi:DUF6879 family protein [Streptomyces sp. NPDC002553]|uniref:DUF6879 family protein n=1 Tax=Streptomyces sp. NPDC002553 TaxID=3154417 RepID=UPI00332EC0B7
MDGESSTPKSAPMGGMFTAPVVLRTLITVVVSLVAYGIADLMDLSQDALAKLGVSIGIGALALIVQCMVGFERRLASMETGRRTRDRELHDHFHQLGKAAGLLSELDQAGMGSSEARRLINSASQVGLQGPDIVRAFVRAEMESLASVVENLTGRTANWSGGNNEWLIRLTGCARRTIDATSSYADRPFWDTDAAGHYLDAQNEAMLARGVSIRRLFMINDADESDGVFWTRFMALCQRQRDLGIEVRFMVLSQQPHTRVAARDVVIFDGELYLEFDTDLQQRTLQTMLVADARRVDGQVRRFSELWHAATEPAHQ